jgi:hypothetical protein
VIPPSEIPDTTEAVALELTWDPVDLSHDTALVPLLRDEARRVIAADRKALEEQGYVIVRLKDRRIFQRISSSDVHNGERYYTIESHIVEGYSATEQVGRGYKVAGNPMMNAVPVYVEVEGQ